MTHLDSATMKKLGLIQQRQKEYIALRLRIVGGNLTVAQVHKIAEVAEKYGSGNIHLSTRQGVEIQNVRHEDAELAIRDLKSVGIDMGACGPRVRIVVACPGEAICKWGIIETKELAEYLDEKYYKVETPHKFKMGVTGCPHNCAKASENDLSLMGGILPKWSSKGCIHCDLCVNICPTTAIYKENNKYKLDLEKCINCSLCTASCPTSTWLVKAKGFKLLIGGTMGKIPRIASQLKELIVDREELNKLMEASLKYYQKHGRKKERFAQTIERIGLAKVKEEILEWR